MLGIRDVSHNCQLFQLEPVTWTAHVSKSSLDQLASTGAQVVGCSVDVEVNEWACSLGDVRSTPNVIAVMGR